MRAGDDFTRPTACSDDAVVRYCRAGVVSPADHWRNGDHCRTRRSCRRQPACRIAGTASGNGNAGDSVDLAGSAGIGMGRGAGVQGGLRWRGAAARVGGVAAAALCAIVEYVRPHRNRDLVDRASRRRRRYGDTDRQADHEYRRLRARQIRAFVPDWNPRGNPHRRRRRCPWLPESPRVDAAEVPARPVLVGFRWPDVPDRRPGALPRQWHPGVSRADR